MEIINDLRTWSFGIAVVGISQHFGNDNSSEGPLDSSVIKKFKKWNKNWFTKCFALMVLMTVTMVVAPSSHLHYHGSSPRWENESLYGSFGGKLVLACLHARNSNWHSLLLKQLFGWGSHRQLYQRLACAGESAATRATVECLRLFSRMTCGGGFEFLSSEKSSKISFLKLLKKMKIHWWTVIT